jgi:hypothetical protein
MISGHIYEIDITNWNNDHLLLKLFQNVRDKKNI